MSRQPAVRRSQLPTRRADACAAASCVPCPAARLGTSPARRNHQPTHRTAATSSTHAAPPQGMCRKLFYWRLQPNFARGLTLLGSTLLAGL
eukprot:365854-Chlamydomonas_euryale.AAC.10